MKYRLLDWLACPSCGTPDLQVQAWSSDTKQSPAEIVDGLLECPKCDKLYPIVGAIPRMLPDSFLEHYGYLSSRYPGKLTKTPQMEQEIAAFQKQCRATAESFGFEWLRFVVTDKPEDIWSYRETTGLTSGDVKGKLVLDAGCGMGRYIEVAAADGAEVVGMDLSRAVERAWRETKHRSQIHLVQGNIMKLPFKPNTFEFIYSIGVLHHTPSTRRAFQSLCPILRPGGRISIWVYQTHQPEKNAAFYKRAFAFLARGVSDGLRVITTRLPHNLLANLCYAAVPLGLLKRKAVENKALKTVLWPVLLLPISHHSKWQVRVCDTFDWLAPQFQWKHTTKEVRAWFEAEGLTDIKILPRAVTVAGIRQASTGHKRGALARSERTSRLPEVASGTSSVQPITG